MKKFERRGLLAQLQRRILFFNYCCPVKVLRGGGWLKAIPNPTKAGLPVARGKANEGSDTPGDAASPPRAVSAKALKGGSAPGGRWFKGHISA